MNTRRKFLIKGGLAATAMLATKPFSAFAGTGSTFWDSGSRVVFIHTAGNQSRSVSSMADAKSNFPRAILLDAGKKQVTVNELEYEIPIYSEDYHIVMKSGIRTGFIRAEESEPGIINKVNTLSRFLKKEKNCEVVVCLSGLGYKNKNEVDDRNMAVHSTHLDIIIGGHPDNFHSQPFILLNKENDEVIINSAAGNKSAIGRIELAFDNARRKRKISFSNSLS